MQLSPLFVATAAAALAGACAFAPSPALTLTRSSPATPSARSMFTGGALGVEEEEDDAKRAQIEGMAKAMGMSVEENQLGMNARLKMEEAIDELRVVGGEEANGVTVERDGNMPPKHLVIQVTEAGKGMGKEKLEKAIVGALKDANEKSEVGRGEAQKTMMTYITDSMKKMG